MSVDINCDLGEGMDNEVELMPYLTSCNVACGGHFGDEESMLSTVRLAIKHGVKIGAHPSYPDRQNFGRKAMKMDAEQLKHSLLNQITAFEKVAHTEQVELSHIKLHGALYNDAAQKEEIAELIVSVIKSLPHDYLLFAPFNSELAKLGLKAGIDVKYEAFADRNYNDDLSLVSRTNHQAMVPKEKVIRHIENILKGVVETISGNFIPIKMGTLCVHGDNPEAGEILKLIQTEFD